MALVSTVRVYRTIDQYFVAESNKDCKNYLEVLNSPDRLLPEEISQELWIMPNVIGQLKKSFKKQIRTPYMILRGFGLYRILEYMPYLEFMEDEPRIESETENVCTEYLLTAENPAVALEYLINLTIPSPKKQTNFEIQTISLDTTFTTRALSRILQTAA